MYKRQGITRCVIAVPIDHIKVHQIHKADALKVILHEVKGLGDAVGVVLGADLLGDAAAGKDVRCV